MRSRVRFRRCLAWELEDEGHSRIACRHGVLFNPDAVNVAAQHRSKAEADVHVGRHVLLGDHSILRRLLRIELRYYRDREIGRCWRGLWSGIGLRVRSDWNQKRRSGSRREPHPHTCPFPQFVPLQPASFSMSSKDL